MFHLKSIRQFPGLPCALIALCFAASAAATETDPFTPGFSGYIQPIVGMSHSKSLSDVSDDNERIDALDQDAESETEFAPMMLWALGYTLDNKSTRFFAGTPEESIVDGTLFLELGIQQKLANGTVLSAAYIPQIPGLDDEAWSDPYQLGTARSETDRESQAFRITADAILGSPLTLKYGFGITDIENEKAGQYHFQQGLIAAEDRQALKRSGNVHQVQALYAVPLGETTLLQPGLVYTRGDMDGRAHSFDRFGGQMTLTTDLGRWQCFTTASVSHAEYDGSNPVFKKTRKGWIYDVTAGAAYKSPFGREDLMVTLFTGLVREDANIKFYDRTALFGGLGLIWTF